jgi:5'-nucleotidase
VHRKLISAAIAACLLAITAGPIAAADPKVGSKDNDTKVQLLAINDFHGHVEASTPGTIQVGQRLRTPADPALTPRVVNITVPAGGAEYLAAYVKQLRATNPNTITVGSGDLIGASPLTSALFHDEPTIEALNEIGMDVSGIGNHEFDEGLAEIYRMLDGGCHPVDGCQDGTPFLGAIFRYLAANVFFAGTNDTVLPPYEIHKVDNAKIAFIGLTLEGTPLIVTPSSIEGLEFRDEVQTVNALVTKLRNEQGVRSFVVLLHQGGFQSAPFSNAVPNADPALALPGWADINSCDHLTGDIVDIANGLSDDVDVIVSGHTHAQYICAGANEIDGKVVTSASSFGRLVTDIDLVIDHQTKDVKSATARNVLVRQDVLPKDPFVTTIVNKYKTLAAPLATRVVGRITEDLKSTRDNVQNAGGESPLGDIIADSQLEATQPTDFGGAVVAFMNPGGIRAPLLYAPAAGHSDAPGEVTYEEIFTVQPFGNTLVVKTCTGAQIQALLEQQFAVATPPRFLQISNSLHYSWSDSAPAGNKVVDSSVMINGAPVDPAASYRVEMNNFLADGGDGFSVFKQCTNQLGGEVDLDAFGRYLMAHSPISAPPYLTAPRITKLP